MKTFLQFLKEMPETNTDTIGKRLIAQPYKKSKEETPLNIKHYNDEYEIHHTKEDGDRHGDTHHFRVVQKKSGNVHLHLKTHTVDGVAHRVSDLAASKENSLKTQYLYYHLLKNKTIKQLYSDHTHSIGAMRVWERFSKLPGIKMRLFNRGKEVYLNKDNWKKNYGNFNTLFHATYEAN